jgi:O-antigen ligase
MVLAWIVIASGALFSAWGLIWRYFVLDFGFNDRFGLNLFAEIRMNLVGVTTIFCMTLAVHKVFWEDHLYCRSAAALCVFPLLMVTIMTQSKATWIATIASLVVLLFRKKLVLIICLFAILGIMFSTPMKERIYKEGFIISFKERIRVAFMSLEVLKDYPIIGIGYGMQTYSQSLDLNAYRKRIPEAYQFGIIYTDPHNMITSVAVRLGIVGLGLFLYITYRLVIMFWISAWRGQDEFIRSWGLCGAAVLTGYGIVGLNEPVFSHVHEVVLCTIVAMINIVTRIYNEDRQKELPLNYEKGPY